MKKRGDTMSLRIDGKKISSDIKEELKEQVKLLKEEGISVCLAVIQVGSDPASSVYVNRKHVRILELSHRLMSFQKRQHRKNCLV